MLAEHSKIHHGFGEGVGVGVAEGMSLLPPDTSRTGEPLTVVGVVTGGRLRLTIRGAGLIRFGYKSRYVSYRQVYSPTDTIT
jgi:hypothetical protein